MPFACKGRSHEDAGVNPDRPWESCLQSTARLPTSMRTTISPRQPATTGVGWSQSSDSPVVWPGVGVSLTEHPHGTRAGSSPHKVNNLNSVPLFEGGFRPMLLFEDMKVVFHRHPVRDQTQVPHKLVHRGPVLRAYWSHRSEEFQPEPSLPFPLLKDWAGCARQLPRDPILQATRTIRQDTVPSWEGLPASSEAKNASRKFRLPAVPRWMFQSET